ncbi:Metal-dependent hydrolase, endonuclease/exonuclease/phosphatase family [Flaviramulus basaltis]|uniref:Metal-dependent hydrolase, endonuclease/exonuclease/phosphatase family n=1 Tax=Flaviramulus basaltis TaxID=369401 RepID=A0A1K2IRH0_9FLAO|nr:endonuclease/exonuclease/phosphatase family protein [Flaviramulus basaltis]SFZ94315.1 Metal-dependent hydrolase, endonuclease/exonuclease/phosphatase family [Flaviramulus basaltis]
MKLLLVIYVVFSSLSFAQSYSVMTYNIKLDYPKEGENSWANRKSFFINQIKFYEPDVLGVQEAMPNQMKDMDSLLVDYSFVGVGRDNGKNEGEYSAIFYKKNKLNVLKSSTFWLSETPEKVSMGWDAVCNRVCTYVLLENKETKQNFLVFNTHFDHVGVIARKKSAILIINKIREINTNKLPVILMGDFNMESKHESIEFILENLKDSNTIAKTRFGPTGTFNGFKFHEPVTQRIDFIFVSFDISVNKYAVLSDNWNLQYPSDHLPVYIQLDL